MLLDFLFPRRCLGCGRRGEYFCQECRQTIKLIENQVCPVCERPAISGRAHPRCQTRYSLDGLTSIFVYKGIIKEAIGKLKYKFITDLAEELIGLSTKYLPPGFHSEGIPRRGQPQALSTLIPVPLHPRRQRWRGFNQSELLGKRLAEKFNWQVRTDILARHKHTKPQIKLKGEERKKNIRGAFRIKPNCKLFIMNSKLILFDDVWTTGSTLRECSQVLKRAGAKEVWGLTLAR
ncbi:ComF family protein [Patescibacteria group bacterium]|nr:ComF family protein [Patescibacteria group bacterium]